MARPRDYSAEYKRRMAKAAARGLTRSQGRGHARSGEASIRPRLERDRDSLEAALKAFRQSGNQSDAARSARISPERFRRFLRENSLAERRGSSWHFTDERLRRMQVMSDGDAKTLTLRGFDQASLNGRHLAAVGQFLGSNKIELLAPFIDQSVIDARGQSHPLETDPNVLHRLAAAGSEVFHDVYRLIQ